MVVSIATRRPIRPALPSVAEILVSRCPASSPRTIPSARAQRDPRAPHALGLLSWDPRFGTGELGLLPLDHILARTARMLPNDHS
jgi:hypothetical protein